MRDRRDRRDRRDLLRRLHRIAGQLRAGAEHLCQLAEDLDDLIQQNLPPTGPLDPGASPPAGPPVPPTT